MNANLITPKFWTLCVFGLHFLMRRQELTFMLLPIINSLKFYIMWSDLAEVGSILVNKEFERILTEQESLSSALFSMLSQKNYELQAA